jgi:hypothetical protein
MAQADGIGAATEYLRNSNTIVALVRRQLASRFRPQPIGSPRPESFRLPGQTTRTQEIAAHTYEGAFVSLFHIFGTELASGRIRTPLRCLIVSVIGRTIHSPL